ncbi:hypothetical protein ACS0TY_006439 [Phlomoides rotata]
MSFTLDAAEKLNIPEVLFFTTSACGFMVYLYYSELVSRGLVPFKGKESLGRRFHCCLGRCPPGAYDVVTEARVVQAEVWGR